MAAPEPVFRRLVAGALMALTLSLTSCSISIQAMEATPGPTDTPVPATSEPTLAPLPTATPIETPTPEPTATATATPMPDMTATAGAAIRARWMASTQQILQIDSTLTDVGTRFQNGSLDTAAAAGQLRQLDQQAGAVSQTIDGLPALPGVDAAALAQYHQTVDQWAAAIRDADARVAANDIFRAPGAVNHLEQVAGSLEQQTANLHLS
ncbi:MAG: hypothetical protein ACR2JY_24555 [Chloroflexota bacterium]